VIFDLDNDGALDIVTNDFNSEPIVLISDPGSAKENSLAENCASGYQVQSQQPGRHPCGYTAAGKSTHNITMGKSGYLSQSVLPLYFGLGDSAKIDSIDVTWPSGTKQTITKKLGRKSNAEDHRNRRNSLS